jgi:hypothetical protein
MEVAGVWATKLGVVALLGYLGWDYRKIRKKAEDSYTKNETKELIDLKIAPVTLKMDNQSESLHDKFDLLLVLVKSDNEANAGRRKEDSDMLHKISTSVAVIETEIVNIKQRID